VTAGIAGTFTKSTLKLDYKTGNMSLKTNLTVTATGEDAFKLLALINEAGLGNSVSVNQEEAPLEGGTELNEVPGLISDEVKEETYDAGQGIVQITEEDFLKLTNQPPKAEEPRKAQKRLVNGKRTYFTATMQKRVRKAAAEGMTVPNIARQFGIPYQSLRDWMMNNGVEYKKDKRGRKPRSS